MDAEDEVQEAIENAEEAFFDGDQDWSGELDIHEFINAFHTNPRFQRRVAVLLHLEVAEVKAFNTLDLESLFKDLDIDCSGTLSIDEFVRGLLEIRKQQEAQLREAEAEEDEEALDQAYMEAAEAFEDADFGYEGELSLQDFFQALEDDQLVEKIAGLTKIPRDFFTSLDAENAVAFFEEIDTDCSGSISFNEWVTALVKIRQTTLKQEREDARRAKREAQAMAEAAFDEGDADWSGEFEFEEFVRAFQDNPRFVRKVAVAASMTVEELKSIDIESLFDFLDTDGSGAISFDEFVRGLLELRKSKEEEDELEAKEAEEAAIDEAYVDAVLAFEDADFGYEDELTLEAFREALARPDVVEKLSVATKVPQEWFQVDDEQAKALFEHIDTDGSGTICFKEWVEALVKFRRQQHQAEMAAAAEARDTEAHVTKLMDAAFDDAEEFVGEFSFERFLHAFRNNPRFLEKVAFASGLPVEEFINLSDTELAGFFEELDEDFSGTVSFDEFVKGLVSVRLQQPGSSEAAPGPELELDEPKDTWTLPQAIKDLPPLSPTERQRVSEAFQAQSQGWNLVYEPENARKLLQDLGFAVDISAAAAYLERAFGGRDTRPGLDLEDCAVLFQVAIDALPLQKPRLKKSASTSALTADDLHRQERALRRVFDGHANELGTVSAAKVGAVLKDIGFKDFSVYSPRFLDGFHSSKRQSVYRFADVAELCNSATSKMYSAAKAPPRQQGAPPRPPKLDTLPQHHQFGLRRSLGLPLEPVAPIVAQSAARKAVSKASQRRRDALHWATRSSGALTLY